jgi:hypothetical protein
MVRKNQPIPQSVKREPVSVELVGVPDRVSYSFGLTLSIGKYEFVRFDASMDAKLEPGETPKEGLKRCSEIAEDYVQSRAEELVDKFRRVRGESDKEE